MNSNGVDRGGAVWRTLRRWGGYLWIGWTRPAPPVLTPNPEVRANAWSMYECPRCGMEWAVRATVAVTGCPWCALSPSLNRPNPGQRS